MSSSSGAGNGSPFKKKSSAVASAAAGGGTEAGESETSTTIAIGKNTYTIVASRKPSSGPGAQQGGGAGGVNAADVAAAADALDAMVVDKKDHISTTTNANGETIRIFRRSRTGGPHPGQSINNSISSVTEDVPPPDTPAATKEASNKLKQLVSRLKGDDSPIDTDVLVSNLEYISEVVQLIVAKTEEEPEDDLSELQSEAVPDEVRKWLASTFAKQEAPARRAEESKRTFKAVANTIRTGIFIEKIYRRMSSSQLMHIPPEISKVLKGIDEWSFDTFHLNRVSKGAPLRYMGYELLTRHGCLHKYKIPPQVLENLLILVENGYSSNGNPYHNNMHACDVLQTTHYFISKTGLVNWLTDLEIFACLMSALIHDFDHSGTTNTFHVNSATELALLYNDRAVLENHHVSAFFKLICDNTGDKGSVNIFNNMQKTDYREFRNLIIDMVLHTDMSQHFSQLKAMQKALLQSHNAETSSFDKNKVLCLLVHSCDVSHPSKRWDIHHQWTSRCMEEFFVQGDREAEAGLEYSPLCDRINTLIPQSQVGFIDYIVQPTLTVLGDVLDAIMAQLNAGANRGRPAAPPLENGTKEVADKDGKGAAALDSSAASASSSVGDSKINRPWDETLPINKAKWQLSHDKGERGIELPNDSWYAFSRPSSAKSTASANAGPRCSSCSCKVNNAGNGSPVGTRLTDVIDDVPASVISPPGSPRTCNDKLCTSFVMDC